MEFVFSKHSLEVMLERQIELETVKDVLDKPDKIIEDKEEGIQIYQGIRKFKNGKNYLVRVFVNVVDQPNVIITLYRTSKRHKY